MKLININKIILNANFKNTEKVFEGIAQLAFKNKDINDLNVVKKALHVREKEISTGLENGFAIPHAISGSVLKPSLYIVVNKTDIKWKTLDGKNTVKYIMCILVPENAKDEHLKILSQAAVLMNNEKFRQIIKTGDKEDIIKYISANINKNANATRTPSKESKLSNKTISVVAVTSCAAGIAHTYMAKDRIESACIKNNWKYKVETQGASGAKNVLTREDIEKADVIFIASDLKIDLSRFKNRFIIETDTNEAIKNAEKIINRAIKIKDKKNKAISEGRDNDGDESAIFNLGAKNKNAFMKALMTAIGYMIPITITGGILMAIPNVIASHYISNGGKWHYPNSFVAGWSQIGGIGLKLMLPIFGMYLAYAIGGRSAMPAGLIGSYAINDSGTLTTSLPNSLLEWVEKITHQPTGDLTVNAGFLGAIAVGAAAGYLVKGLKWINFPKVVKPVAPIMVLPIISTFMIYVFVLIIAIPLILIMGTFFSLLDQSNGASPLILPLIGMLFAGMIAIDLGGPFNKTALVVATAIFTSAINGAQAHGTNPLDLPYSDFVPQTATQAAISVPPLGAWLATTLFKHKFSSAEKQTGQAAFGMGLVGISEGAIPFAITNPLRAVISNIAGAMVAGGLVVLFGCRFFGGLGSPLGTFLGYIPGEVPYIGWIVSVCAGALTTALIFGFTRPRVLEYEESYALEKEIKNDKYQGMGLLTRSDVFWFNVRKIFIAIFHSIMALLNPRLWFKDPNLVGDPKIYKITKIHRHEEMIRLKYEDKIEIIENLKTGFQILIDKDDSEKGSQRLFFGYFKNDIKSELIKNKRDQVIEITNLKSTAMIRKIKSKKHKIDKRALKDNINKVIAKYRIKKIKILIVKNNEYLLSSHIKKSEKKTHKASQKIHKLKNLLSKHEK